MVDVVTEQGRQHFWRTTPSDKDQKQLDLFGQKSYTFQIMNYKAVMAKYNFTN